MRRLLLLSALAAAACLAAVATAKTVWLPTGWRISAPTGAVHAVGLFPQGIALSPHGSRLAVVDSGLGPPALLVLDASTLARERAVALKGAFGKPVWVDGNTILVAGENDDAVEAVHLRDGSVTRVTVPKGSWVAQVARSRDGELAVSDDMTSRVSWGRVATSLSGSLNRSAVVGRDPSDLCFSPDGKFLYVALRGERRVAIVNTASGNVAYADVGLHPSALALSRNGATLYVAETDDDALGIVDTHTRLRIADVDLRLHDGRTSGYGASPNALVLGAHDVYVSLGAENAVAVVRDGALLGRIPVGWYPSGLALGNDHRLYVSDAKGESSPANPAYDPFRRGSQGYVGASLDGSIRLVDARALDTAHVIANASQNWVAPLHTVVRPGGPIKHVIYIIKENRTYDQVLGDIPGADGDPNLAWFGERFTPNQHAIAERFGVFDRTFADAQISADGHNWSTAAIASDYVERFWPQNYSGRRPIYDFEDGDVAGVPHNGYLWDDAAGSHVTYRDYGEFVDLETASGQPAISHMRDLDNGHVDPQYPGWNLEISDQVRYEAWKAEFDKYVAADDLPQLEIVRLPNDHTMGTRPGALTPQAYVAQNDYALGEIVDAVSHSPYWATTAIFAIEDDAQNGPDHVDDQRTTLYVASPYALQGTHHEIYTTASVLHTIEIILGMPPMTIYDSVAPPLYAAFGFRPNLRPYDAIPPKIDVNARNTAASYGAAASMRLDFAHADEANPFVLNDILAHACAVRKRADRQGASR